MWCDTQVINAGAFAYDKSPALKYLDVPVVDSRESDLAQHFEECSDFIDEARTSNGQVLVHCHAGRWGLTIRRVCAELTHITHIWMACRSRSATLVCSYLISKGGMTVGDFPAVG